jgi:hypothetical protein
MSDFARETKDVREMMRLWKTEHCVEVTQKLFLNFGTLYASLYVALSSRVSRTNWFIRMLQRTGDPLSRPFDEEFASLTRRFLSHGIVEVDFRAIVGNSSATDRLTHLLHPYPAKLLLNIPLFFLNCGQLLRPGDVVYDPFCGSGTVLVEALARGAVPQGCDSNPLARLITAAKTTFVPESELEDALERTMAAIPRRGNGVPEGSLNLQRWFTPPVLTQLDRLLAAIRNATSGTARIFLEVCFSTLLTKVSLADPTVPVPVIINPKRPSLSSHQRTIRRRWLKERSSAAVFTYFEMIARENIIRLQRLRQHVPRNISLGEDARTATLDSAVDLVISSPPYGSAQKYIRSSSLSLQWLGLASTGLRDLERRTIGREHFNHNERNEVPIVTPSSEEILHDIGKINPLRKHIAATFLVEMQHAIARTYELLRPRGHAIFVVGNNMTCGKVFNTALYLTEICEALGFRARMILEDRILSRGLITRRHDTSNVITKETVLVFQKG